MNRNIKKEIIELANFIEKLKDKDEIINFVVDIFTPAELETLSKRWCILNMLVEGKTQRCISQKLGVSLCKVTRGSRILKHENSIIAKYLIKEKKNDKIQYITK